MDRPLTAPLSGPQSVITASLTYSSDCIKALCVQPLRIPRATRKILFLYGIWRPRAEHPSLERRLAGSTPAQETASTLPSVPAAASPINGLRLATWNIHSLRHKDIAVADMILSEGLDLLMVTESWYSSPTDVVVCRSAPPGYSYVDCPRESTKDEDGNFGGLVIYHRTALTTRRVIIPDRPTTFEALGISVASPQGPLTVINIYRPGSEAPSAAFFVELAALFEHFALHNTQLAVAGDFNLHLEDPALPEAVEFALIAEQFGLRQWVSIWVVGWTCSSHVTTANLWTSRFTHLLYQTMASSSPRFHFSMRRRSTSRDCFATGRHWTEIPSVRRC